MRILIKPKSCISSNLSKIPEENNANYIDIIDEPFNETGAQGIVYDVTHINGKPVIGLLVKSFGQDFQHNIREIVDAIRDNRDKYKIDQCIALKALPLFLFEGELNDNSLYGYVMYKVEGKPFKELIDENINTYVNIPLEDRLQFCLQFAEGMNILYSLTIIHADINGQNLMVDIPHKRISIIDLDGGSLAKTGSVPKFIKKETGWLAPEIISQLKGKSPMETVNVKITADLWSIACGIHYFLFGLSPFFFIENQPDIRNYLQTYNWPQLKGIKGITTLNDHIFDYYEEEFSKVSELHKYFKQSYQEGYSYPSKRISAYLWVNAIKNAQLKTYTSTPRKTTYTSRGYYKVATFFALAIIIFLIFTTFNNIQKMETPSVSTPISQIPVTATAEPRIQASPYTGLQGTLFKFSGSGFTPTGDVAWHVLKPDGTENPVKVLVADSSGNLNYQYLSTCKSMAGLYITWAIDMVTGTQHFRNLNWAIAPAPECKGVQLTLTTDKASYNSGENIKFTLTNKYPYELPMGGTFNVLAKDGTVVWVLRTWTDPINIPATAGNSKSVIEWNQKFPSNIPQKAQINNPKYFDVNHNLVPGEYKGTWGTSVVSLETSLFTIKPPVPIPAPMPAPI